MFTCSENNIFAAPVAVALALLVFGVFDAVVVPDDADDEAEDVDDDNDDEDDVDAPQPTMPTPPLVGCNADDE